MKTALVMVGLLAGLAASAQSSRPDTVLKQTTDQLRVQVQSEPIAKPNQVSTKKVTYSGIVVQLVKSDKPLQMINPAAPAEYGPAEQNVVRNPVNGRVMGWKFLSLQF